MNTFTLGFQKYFMINSFRSLIHFNSSLFFSDKNYTVVIERIFIWYQRKKKDQSGCFFSSVPRPRPSVPINFFTALGSNYFFTAPNDGITFSQPTSTKNYLFTATSNKRLSCLFYSFKQNSNQSLLENSFKQKVLSHINQAIAV